MTMFTRDSLFLSRRCRVVSLTLFFAAAYVGIACAQTSTTPSSQFQYSALTGSGNSITATRVPVITSKGQTIYQDLTLQFDVDSDGNLTLTAGYPVVVPSPNLLVSNFKTGKYVGPRTQANGKFLITISGPGVLDGGATAWSVAPSEGADAFVYPASATFYVGPLDSNPLAARIKKAGITSTSWSFGVGGALSNSVWDRDSLLGFSQIGNTIAVVSFTSFGSDKNLPVDQITYTLVP